MSKMSNNIQINKYLRIFVFLCILLPNFLHAQETRVNFSYRTYISAGTAELTFFEDNLYISGNTNSPIDQTAIDNFSTAHSGVVGYVGIYINDNGWESGRYFSGSNSQENFIHEFGSNKSIYLAGLVRGNAEILNAFDNTYGTGASDGYIAKLDSNYNLLWATYWGGDNLEVIKDIALDSEENLIVVGSTFGSTTGISNNGFQNVYGGNRDGMIAKYDKNGNQLWASYYGGNGEDQAFGVDVDENDDLYICGYTSSSNQIYENGFQNSLNGVYDAFIAKFDSQGNRIWGTYYGGTGNDQFREIKLKDDNIFLSGQSSSTDVIGENGFN
ncbi:SBBP repeat-containing protein, partial [Candidatus Kapabacteria bacterium]|nr:SBBP repeat-containing protein [Candidatus Kapabacteria bacterium]